MKRATIRDLRYHFDRIENELAAGVEIQITRRKRVIARLLPPETKASQRPDFMRRLREIYGSRRQAVSGAELIAEERSRY